MLLLLLTQLFTQSKVNGLNLVFFVVFFKLLIIICLFVFNIKGLIACKGPFLLLACYVQKLYTCTNTVMAPLDASKSVFVSLKQLFYFLTRHTSFAAAGST